MAMQSAPGLSEVTEVAMEPLHLRNLRSDTKPWHRMALQSQKLKDASNHSKSVRKLPSLVDMGTWGTWQHGYSCQWLATWEHGNKREAS